MSNDMIQKATTQATAKTPDAKTYMKVYIKQMQGEIKKALPAAFGERLLFSFCQFFGG